MATHIDPVCGMTVDDQKAGAQSTYEGKAYYFCCARCQVKFDANPQQYTGQKAAS